MIDIVIKDKIIEFLQNNPGKTARDISASLNIERKEVNRVLYNYLREKCSQDVKYKWYLTSDFPQQKITLNNTSNSIETPLSKLCRYYSACIAEDHGVDVSVFAQSKYGFDYEELNKIPFSAEEESTILSTPRVQNFLNKTRRDNTGSQKNYFGYPILAIHIRSNKSKWEGYKLVPVFLFAIKNHDEIGASGNIDFNFPILNKNVVEKFTRTRGEELIREIVSLEEELGLSGDGDQPDIDDLVQRLKEIRPDWVWNEKIDPYNLSNKESLVNCDKEGIFNKALFLNVSETPGNFTRGLEYELKKLSELSESEYINTTLGQWVHRNITKNNKNNLNPLLEILPMNSEQRKAVEKSLTSNLSVITGPPGTGKSQVVTNLLMNASWQNKRVLFASKNNKAVDVVEVRVNNIGNNPILLRMGGKNEYQSQLIKYLSNFLSISVEDEDKKNFELEKNRYEKIQEEIFLLGSEEQDLISLRNQLDNVDKEIDVLREEFSKSLFGFIKKDGFDCKNKELLKLIENIEKITKNSDNFIMRLFLKIFRKSIYDDIRFGVDKLGILLKKIEVGIPENKIDDSNLKIWSGFAFRVQDKLRGIEKIKTYFSLLKELQDFTPLEKLVKQKTILMDKMSIIANSLWKLWLKIRVSAMSDRDRSILSQYKTTLQMVSNDSNSKSVWRSYYEQSQQVSHILPCWAITSLSAKGRIPFSAGIFDLVVFDEASQCDIASALPLLFRAKQAVIIGDPNQLAHISPISKIQDERLLEQYGLLGSYNDWAYSYNSLYDLASGLAIGEDILDLRDHYRSHADIVNFSNNEFYGGRLRVATKYDSLKKDKYGMGIRWVDIKGKAQKPSSGSGSENLIEAKKVLEEIERLVAQGYEGTIGVVSPFRAQANLINKLVSEEETLLKDLQGREFLCETVHRFQGDERDIMIFSPVISIGMPIGSLIFLKKTGNLFNVAITRARAVLVVVGDLKSVMSCGVSYMEKFSKYVSELDQKKDTQVYTPKYGDCGSDYPVVSNPERVSEWEHVFYKALHNADIKAIPQYQEERYTLDFAILNNKNKLNIEIDGEHYHKDWTGELCYRDQIRNQRMFELGWDVIRFWVYEVRDDMEGCIKRVNKWIKESDSNFIIKNK